MRRFSFYFIGTPIGNLEDLSMRAVSILGEVDTLWAEDTRKTRTLLQRYGIEVPVRSFHDHNKERVTPGIVEGLAGGGTGALVSDAGMPGISDPGYYLVNRLIEEGIGFTVIPGPSAVTTALVLSGLPSDRFEFLGYLPRKRGALEKALEEAGASAGTSIFFESPHRIGKTLEAAARVLGGREIAVAREMTKLHEEVIRGSAGEIIDRLGERKIRGEITLLVRGKGRKD
ncbi:MAG TPA: 16S rRNA (cytidine(1402)-2'-O)-methyltransferase [Candidatus Krumholzibacterium sp.]|nr:16S rRNA (cytidine(1402)-2'-O)-methyltransferase [Candidatus Krumholzibacterium sp.]